MVAKDLRKSLKRRPQSNILIGIILGLKVLVENLYKPLQRLIILLTEAWTLAAIHFSQSVKLKILTYSLSKSIRTVYTLKKVEFPGFHKGEKDSVGVSTYALMMA